jgi:hypothetical protein
VRRVSHAAATPCPTSRFSVSTGAGRGSEQVAAGKQFCRSRGRPQETTRLSTADRGAVNNTTGVVPSTVHRPVGGAVDGSGPACHGARRHEAPGEQRLSLCKGKAEREPAVTGGLVSHHQGGRFLSHLRSPLERSRGQQSGSTCPLT